MPDARYGMQDMKYEMRDTRYEIQDADVPMGASCNETPVIGKGC
jgi:hypothetical protein